MEEEMIAYIYGMTIGIILIAAMRFVKYLSVQDHKDNHQIEVTESWSTMLYDHRRPDCRYCTRHSWDLWQVDYCICDRCRHIRSLEKELFNKHNAIGRTRMREIAEISKKLNA